MVNNNDSSSKQQPSLALDLRIVALVLLAIIIGMLVIWRPWDKTSDMRTVEATGNATVTARPDQFVFYPSYEFSSAEKDAALSQVTKKSDELVAKLKELGVGDAQIKTNAGSHGDPQPLYLSKGDSKVYTLQLTVTVKSDQLAQKVQDYLVTTSPSGTITPYADFSEAKRSELENQARVQAAKDARQKADQMAKELGFKVLKVKAVQDGVGFAGSAKDVVAPDSAQAGPAPALTVQPGENDLSYSVTVSYFID